MFQPIIKRHSDTAHTDFERIGAIQDQDVQQKLRKQRIPVTGIGTSTRRLIDWFSVCSFHRYRLKTRRYFVNDGDSGIEPKMESSPSNPHCITSSVSHQHIIGINNKTTRNFTTIIVQPSNQLVQSTLHAGNAGQLRLQLALLLNHVRSHQIATQHDCTHLFHGEPCRSVQFRQIPATLAVKLEQMRVVLHNTQ